MRVVNEISRARAHQSAVVGEWEGERLHQGWVFVFLMEKCKSFPSLLLLPCSITSSVHFHLAKDSEWAFLLWHLINLSQACSCSLSAWDSPDLRSVPEQTKYLFSLNCPPFPVFFHPKPSQAGWRYCSSPAFEEGIDTPCYYRKISPFFQWNHSHTVICCLCFQKCKVPTKKWSRIFLVRKYSAAQSLYTGTCKLEMIGHL